MKLKSHFLLLFIIFQFNILQARELPGHTGGGHLVDGKLLDFYISGKTTKFIPKDSHLYPEVEQKLLPLIKLLPGLGYKLLNYFNKVDWYLTKEKIRCPYPDQNFMIEVTPPAEAFACQNKTEVIINENLFFSIDEDTQSWGLIHELLRAYQIELKEKGSSFNDNSLFRFSRVIKKLGDNPNSYDYMKLTSFLNHENITPWHDRSYTTKDDFTEVIKFNIESVNLMIKYLYTEDGPIKNINYKTLLKEIQKYDRKVEESRFKLEALSALEQSNIAIFNDSLEPKFYDYQTIFINIVKSSSSEKYFIETISDLQEKINSLNYDDLLEIKHRFQNTLELML